MSAFSGALFSFVAAAAVVSAALVAVFVVAKVAWGIGMAIGGVFTGVGRFVLHIASTLRDWVTDVTRILGGTLTGVAYVPLSLFSVALGRWSSAKHYGKAMRGEFGLAALSTYKAGISHPLRLIGLGSLLDGFERRLPEVVLYAPGADTPKEGKNAFEGWKVVGSLPAGGSGGKLYLAEPKAEKVEKLARVGVTAPAKAVIKSFSLASGSTLPQIVRESRALEAAKSLGLVVEHELSPTRFHYVMPFVPGEDLSKVSTALHSRAGRNGLRDAGIRAVIGYGAGLCEILDRFHAAGLWHKDIKPSNILVCGDRVELVDLGLVTPLGSAMTLTTHGTEYYRDPEMVRLALKGVKVHEVDGVKFDLYSTGAVLYSLVEGSFPAHGNLSSFSKRCPDALSWVIRRAMADVNQRYAGADEMLTDLRVLLAATDPFSVKPADLPSMGGSRSAVRPVPAPPEELVPAEFASDTDTPSPDASEGAPPPLPLHRLSAHELRQEVRRAARDTAREARVRARRVGSQARKEARAAAGRATLEARQALRAANVRAKEQARAAFAASEEWHVKRRMTKEKSRQETQERRKTRSRQSATGFLALFAVGFLWIVAMSSNGERPGGGNPVEVPVVQGLIRAQSKEIQRVHEQLISQGRTTPRPPRSLNSTGSLTSAGGKQAPQVLLLSERPLVAGVDAERRLAAALEQQLGWRVLGEEGTLPRSGSELDLLARVRSTAGLSSLGDSAASKRLVDLIERRDDLDAIVWFGVDEGEHLQVELLAPRNTDWGAQWDLGRVRPNEPSRTPDQLSRDLRGLERDLRELFDQMGSNQVLRQAFESREFEGGFENQFQGLERFEGREVLENSLFGEPIQQECGGSEPAPSCQSLMESCWEEPGSCANGRLAHAG